MVALPSPLLRYGGQLFSSARQRRKQTGPTLSGRRIESNGQSSCYLLPEWITVKYYILIGRVHSVSKIGMILLMPWLTSPVCPTIYPWLEGEQLYSYLYKEYQRYVKCNQPRPGFELGSLCPFPTTITITPRAPPSVCLCASVYVYLCVRVCVCLCMYVCVCLCVYIRVFECVFVCTYARVCVCHPKGVRKSDDINIRLEVSSI